MTSGRDIRTDVNVGTLFVPDGAARINEDIGAALASKGFVVLVLAYFRHDGLPRDYSHVRVEYFERAIEMGQGLEFGCYPTT